MTTKRRSDRRLAPLVCLLVLAAAAAAIAEAQGRGARTAFDGARAYEHVRRVVAFGPRPSGSAALDQTRQYIVRELKAIGIDAVEQTFVADTPIGRIRMANVVARIPGASPARLVFAGHFDTKIFREFPFVGANDAGSSTAFLLEWAHVLKARQNALTMEVLFLDGEESIRADWMDPDNRYGSRHYVRAGLQDGSLKQVRALVLVDMIGDRDPRYKRESYSTRWLTDLIWATAKRLNYGGIFLDEETAIEDDHKIFLDAGVPAADIIDMDYPPWHTAGDTLDKVSARSMQVVGEVLAEALPSIEKRLAGPTGTKR